MITNPVGPVSNFWAKSAARQAVPISARLASSQMVVDIDLERGQSL